MVLNNYQQSTTKDFKPFVWFHCDPGSCDRWLYHCCKPKWHGDGAGGDWWHWWQTAGGGWGRLGRWGGLEMRIMCWQTMAVLTSTSTQVHSRSLLPHSHFINSGPVKWFFPHQHFFKCIHDTVFTSKPQRACRSDPFPRSLTLFLKVTRFRENTKVRGHCFGTLTYLNLFQWTVVLYMVSKKGVPKLICLPRDCYCC